MQQDELVPHINTKSLGALLPEEYRKSLEEQYLSHKEVMQNDKIFSILIMTCAKSGHTKLNTYFYCLKDILIKA